MKIYDTFDFRELRSRLEEGQPFPNIAFEHKNVLDADFSDATSIYWNNLCFPEDASETMLQKLKNVKAGTKILCSKKFCHRHGIHCLFKQKTCCSFVLINEDFVKCTWTPKLFVYVYQKMA